MKDLPDVFETLTLLFADDVKMVTQRPQSMNLHSSLTAAWDWSKGWDLPINPAECNFLTLSPHSTLKAERLRAIRGTTALPLPYKYVGIARAKKAPLV